MIVWWTVTIGTGRSEARLDVGAWLAGVVAAVPVLPPSVCVTLIGAVL
jgi:hypothetical protein